MATNKDKLIATVQKLVEKGQFEKAIKEYLKVVAEDDKDVRIWLKIGDLYAKIGKKDEAAQTYQKVALFYSEQGFYLKSVAVYKQILKIDPRLIEVNQRLAELYKQLGLLSDAMQQYETVASFFSHEGKTREALTALKQIVELDPETVANRIKLAELYSKEQMPREAIEEFTRAAEQLREAGRIDDFMKVAERLLFHSPDNRPVTKELARLYIEKGDPRRALPKLQICFKADPRDVEVLSLLARAFEALDQRSKSASVLKELARILGENGDQAGRADVFRKILALAPGDADAEAGLRSAPQPSSGGAPVSNRSGGVKPISSHDFDDPPVTGVEEPSESAPLPARVALPDAASTVGYLDPVGAVSNSATDDEAIIKILNETDVYIKYNLHNKAIEHLQRAFERNPRHVEAREKLKALYLIIGKREEAVLELWSLVEHSEPGRTRRYLREILDIDPGNARAAGMLGDPAPNPPRTEVEDPRSVAESLDLEDVEELSDMELSDSAVELSDSAVMLSDSAVMLPDSPDPDDNDDDDLIPLVVQPVRRSEPARRSGESVAVDLPVDSDSDLADSDRFSLDDDAEETGARPSIMNGLDGDEDDSLLVTDSAVAFDSPEPMGDQPTPMSDQPARTRSRIERDELQTTGTFEEAAPRPESSLEDDLDEADFFIQQNLFEEGRAILESLFGRYPEHPLVAAKMRDLEAMELAAVGRPEPVEAGVVSITADQSAEFMAMDQVVPSQVDEPGTEPTFEMTRRSVIDKGVTAEDFETHYDLGIAYKEMGLLDDAIVEFKVVMKDATREVQCHMMIGLCCVEKGLHTEAIGQFKKGLYVEGITDREALSMYFELGQAYERLEDPREALYYYEKVTKRDPHFRDVGQRLGALRAGASGSQLAGAPATATDDVEAALAGLMSERD